MRARTAVFSAAVTLVVSCGSFDEASTPSPDAGGDAASGVDADAAVTDGGGGPDGAVADGGCASRAAKFDGNAYFQVDMPAGGFDPTALTVEAWVFVPARAADRLMHVVSHRAADDLEGWALVLEAGAKLAFYSYVGGTGTPLGGSPQTQVPTNEWVHIAATRNGLDAAIYIDGVQAALSNSLTPSKETTRNLRIGLDSNVTGSANGFTGLIEEVRISKIVRVVSSANVPMTLDGDTVALWRFEDDGNAIDATGAKTARAEGVVPRVCMKKFLDDEVTPP